MPTRRAVLQGAAGLAVLTACGGPRSVPAASSTPRRIDWDALRRKVSGTLRLPTDAGYDAQRLLFDRLFDDVRPAAVLGARTPADVQAGVAFARAQGLPVTARSGGHSYVGASVNTGLVIDLRAMATVTPGPGVATVGPGAPLLDVYTGLAAHGQSLPAGSCPSVGVSGLALGGGQGVVSRTYGLTCDRVRSAQVALADGRLVTASATSEPDLFWALRGGGASFGIVTSWELETHPTQGLSTSYHAFPWSEAPAVLTAWSEHLPAADRSVWSTCHLLATTDAAATVTVSCVRVGSSDGLRSALAPFLAAVPAPTSASIRDRTYLDTMLLEAGCSSAASCLPAQRDAFVAGSSFFTAPIPASAAEELAAAVEARQKDTALGVGGAAFDTWGGAIADVAADATPFPHRSATYCAQYTASWMDAADNGPADANRTSLAALQEPLRTLGSGAYANYVAPGDSPADLYGANLSRLRSVKHAYDPENVFAPPQGITP